MSKTTTGSIMVLGAAILWSLSGVIIKTVDTSILWIMIIRGLSAGIFLSPFLFRRKISPVKTLIFTGITMAIFLSIFALTTKIGNSAMAVAMQYAAPMYVISYGFIKNKEIKIPKLLVLILICIGVCLNILDGLRSANPLAILSGLGIGIAFIAYTALIKNIKEGSPLGIVSAVNFISALCFILLLPFNDTPAPGRSSDLPVLILAGILISAISYALYGAGIRKINMETAMVITLAEPVLNPVWVFIGTGERPPVMTFIGLLFILAAAAADILLSTFYTSKTKSF